MNDEPSVVEVDARAVPAEARAYQGHRAGAVSRTVAGAIDLAVVVAGVAVLYAVWSSIAFILDPSAFRWPEPGIGLLWIVGVVLGVVYLGSTWWGTGRSYGNQVMGLRVVNFRGERLRLPTAFLRAVVCIVFPVGLYWCLISKANRSIADVILRSSVIYDWQIRPATRRKAGSTALRA